MIAIAPPFFAGFQSTFIGQTSPDAGVGSNLFTFMCERYLMSLTQLTCPPAAFQPVVCQIDAASGAATSCVITLQQTANATSGTEPTQTKTGMGMHQTNAHGGKGTNNGVQPSLSSAVPTSSAAAAPTSITEPASTTEPVSPCSMSPAPSPSYARKYGRERRGLRMESE
jgi:hypothetical protein